MRYILFGIFFLVAAGAPAQTNAPAASRDTNSSAPVSLTTNWVKSVDYFRRVNGQLYNTRRSERFETLRGKIADRDADLVVLHVYQTKQKTIRYGTGGVGNTSWESAGGSLGGPRVTGPASRTHEYEEYDRTVAIRHAPNLAGAAEGQRAEYVAMRVGTTKYDEREIELWDCGTPNLVPVVVTNGVTR